MCPRYLSVGRQPASMKSNRGTDNADIASRRCRTNGCTEFICRMIVQRGAFEPFTVLRSPEVRAGFSSDVQEALRSQPTLVTDIAPRLLERHFPDSIHQDILSAVGLELGVSPADRKRDPKFRHKVLLACEWRCREGVLRFLSALSACPPSRPPSPSRGPCRRTTTKLPPSSDGGQSGCVGRLASGHAEQQDVAPGAEPGGFIRRQNADVEEGGHLVEEGPHLADVAVVVVQVQVQRLLLPVGQP